MPEIRTESEARPGLAQNNKSLAEKMGVWAGAALACWIVLAIIVVGSVKITQWLF